MPIDVNQFLPTFIDETQEMLEEAEQLMLHIEVHAIHSEDVNRIFRIMHSIKGNSAVFNFTAMNELTHTLETFLNNFRTLPETITESDIDIIFKSIDCLREMINAISKKTAIDESKSKELKKLIEKKLTLPATPIIKPEQNKEKAPTKNGWEIHFSPDRQFFKSGNDPMRLFQALKELGQCEILVDADQIPAFSEFNPEECFLKWNIKLYGDVTKEQIEELFVWVTDLKNINLQSMTEIKTASKIMDTPVNLEQATSVRVSTEKIDFLINMVGELAITQSLIGQIIKDSKMDYSSPLNDAILQLEENARELQTGIMRMRMVPIEFVFNRFPRMVYDLSKKMGKKIQLVMSGGETELDKNMIEKLTNPLLHLIRNAIDHGIELPELRKHKRKPESGTIQLKAYQDGANIIIKVIDDGSGLNKEAILKKALSLGLVKEGENLSTEDIHQLIFHPGFSTSHTISDISGRGVGLDVVAKNIHDIKGSISIETTEEKGTTFILRIPLTLAIMDCQLVKVSGQIYIIPLNNITEMLSLDQSEVKSVDEDNLLYHYREAYIPLIFLHKMLNGSHKTTDLTNQFMIVVEIDNQLVGFVVDELLSQQRVVIKNLEENYKQIPGISGVTILGDGNIALIIDITTIVNQTLHPKQISEKVKFSDEVTAPIESDNVPKNQGFEFLTFLMSGKEFGVDLAVVREIRMLEKVTLFPNTPPYMKGAINVRGLIVPIIDLSEYFSLKKFKSTLMNVIITLNVEAHNQSRCIGTIVEQVLDTHTIQYKDIMPLPPKTHSELKNYVKGIVTVEGKMIMLLNTQHLIEMVSE